MRARQPCPSSPGRHQKGGNMSASPRIYIIIYEGGEVWQGHGLLWDLLMNEFPGNIDHINAIVSVD